MDASAIWQFLHVACMFLAVSMFVGQGILVGAVVRSLDVRAIRRVTAAEDRFAPVGGAAFALGIVFGFVTALTSDIDLTATWLLIGYALAVLIFVTGMTYHRGLASRIRAALASSDDEASPELRAIAGDRSGRLVNVLDALAWLGVIFVMVAKPFS